MRLQYHPEMSFAFPTTRCCNCGAKDALSIRAQDTKLTRYFGVGGTETTLSLPLCVCRKCERSLKRRAPNWFSRMLTWLAVAAALFLAAVTLGEDLLSGIGPWFNDHLVLISLAASAVLMAMVIKLRQPRPEQSSYFQPVRLRAIDRAFNAPYIEGIALEFTNSAYLRDFLQLNSAAVQAGYVRATECK